jgi:queuosine precursor transporter
MIVLAYLGAVVAANLIIAAVGPAAVLPVAFSLVGLTMVARDRLHDAWHGEGLRWKMAALVGVGALLTVAINAGAWRIALASSVAFAVSETVNALVYQRRWPWLVRSNAGNVPNALTDSVLFIGIAFGGLWGLMLLQAAIKIGGGVLWSLLLRSRVAAVAVVMLLAAPLSAQIASVGAGTVATEHGAEPAVDLYLAGPPVAGMRPSAVASWSGEWAYITKLSHPLVQEGPAFINLDAGASWLAFRDYRPEPMVGLYAQAPLPLPRTSLSAAVAWEPWQRWGWVAVARLDLLLWMRR